MTANKEENFGFADYLYAFIFLALFAGIPAFFMWSVTPDFIRYPLFYSVRYQIPYRHVIVGKKPNDCDWWHSPLGNKSCHYERFVLFQPEAGHPISRVHVGWFKMQK